jgi:uncharacterized protein RhaS with RHS repeats
VKTEEAFQIVPPNLVTTYTYDPLGRLTQVNYPAASVFADTTYTYDAVGNRTQTINGGTTLYTPNALNQYTDVGGTPFTYDANGNLTSDEKREALLAVPG